MFLVVIRFRPMLIIAGGAVRGNLMPFSYAGARSTCSRAAILDTVAAHAGICYGVSQGDLWFKPRGSAEIRENG
uniref:Uncharacterized protein n=1 Tax=Triticum urartu TaxID=4572 RepID=A0A8R7U564_TRIUA